MRIILLVVCSCFLARFASGQLVLYSSNWKYYDLGVAPPSQSGVNWMESAYSDVSWNSGPAQLGYGDGDEATLISSATLTGYFRQTFYVNNVADFSNLILQLIYDDGAVIYINGIEVWRRNMPTGTIMYGTFASSNSSDNATASDTVTNSLVNGANVIAVEVHQVSSSSSDISFDMSIFGVPAPGITVVTRGPYLQKANASSAIIRWRTNVPTASIVDFGPATNLLANTINDPSSTTEHSVTITGLAPATKYYYQIRTVGDTLIFPAADVYFKTYPVQGAASPLTAWILGDCGTGGSNARNVRNAYYNYIGTQHTDMMLFLGDNAYVDGTDAEYQTALFQNMYEQKLKNTIAWSCLGNHDGHSANSNMQTGPYYDIFSFPVNGECGGVASGTEAYYSFDFGNVHFIVLDSYGSDRSPTGPMHMWCENDLQNTLADWIITFWHHPAYSKGSHDSDVDIELKLMRENFLPLFESYGVDLVLSGHSHSYERSFLLNGHYGLSSTFNINTNTVGIMGSGSGQSNTPYYKAPVGPEGGKGAVYVTTGSSGQATAAPLNHPAMFFDAAVLGSCVLKINLDTLKLIFLRQNGALDDQFTLIKDQNCIPGNACNDSDPCTINDAFDNNCYCRGIPNLRLVTSTADAGSGTLRAAVSSACEGDTIRFTSAVNDTIRLNTEIVVDKDLVILGLSSQNIVLSGQLITRIFNIPPAIQVTLSRLTLCKGSQSSNGGAILNNGSLFLEHTVFISNWQGAIPKAWTNNNLVLVRQGNNYIRL